LGQPLAGQLARDGERREDGVEHRHIVAAPGKDKPERLELASERTLPRVEGLELRPVRDLTDRVLRAGLRPVRGALIGDPAPPVLDAIDPARHDLEEIEIPVALEGQHGVGEATRGVVHVGNVPPEGNGRRSTALRPKVARTRSRFVIGSGVYHFATGNFRGALCLTVREGEAADVPAFLERLRAGDTRAFEELVATHQHRVFGVALRMLGSAAEAEEIAQEAFLRAHRSLPEFRGDAKLSTWLYAIVSRLCLNRLAMGERKAVRHGEEILLRVADPHRGPDADAERGEMEAALHRAIAELAEDRRVVGDTPRSRRTVL